jgi:hypothetical protein
MQDAETVLAVLRERGRKGLPCDELYRQLFNRRRIQAAEASDAMSSANISEGFFQL